MGLRGRTDSPEFTMTECNHDWNVTSNLRLVVEDEHYWMGALVPSTPHVLQIDFCRLCGLIRLPTRTLADIRTVEAEKHATQS